MSLISICAGKRVVHKDFYTFASISAAALLTLTVSMACAATTPVLPETLVQADRATTEQVYEALAGDPYNYFRHVDVSVQDGVATLSGFVFEPQEIYRAREVTARVPGVVRVVNEIELEIF